MGDNRPDPKRLSSKSDVMQAALQQDAFAVSPEDPAVLQYADDADGNAKQARRAPAVYDEHEWDDVVQQTFPASDAPPPPGRTDHLL